MESRVMRFLNDVGIRYEIHSHPPRTSFLDNSDELGSLDPALAVKSLAYLLPDGSFVIVALKARARADYKSIVSALGVRRDALRPAPMQRLQEMEMQAGGVAPVPLRGARVLMDANLLECDTIYCGSGRSDATLAVSPQDLSRLPGVVVQQISFQ